MLSQVNTVEQKAEAFCQENEMEYTAFKPGFKYGATDGIWCRTTEGNKVVKRLATWVKGDL